ncbi:DnaJ (Hsp40), sub C, member 2, partial [Perkinsus olseni]
MRRSPSCYYRLLLFLLLLAEHHLALSRAAEDHRQPPAAALHGSLISEGYDVHDEQQQQQAYDWDLVIVIPSHITEFSRRCAVRDGWARQLRDHEQSLPLVHITPIIPLGITTAIRAEMKQFDDIITLPLGFVDRYDALGTKVRLSYGEVVDKLG